MRCRSFTPELIRVLDLVESRVAKSPWQVSTQPVHVLVAKEAVAIVDVLRTGRSFSDRIDEWVDSSFVALQVTIASLLRFHAAPLLTRGM